MYRQVARQAAMELLEGWGALPRSYAVATRTSSLSGPCASQRLTMAGCCDSFVGGTEIEEAQVINLPAQCCWQVCRVSQ